MAGLELSSNTGQEQSQSVRHESCESSECIAKNNPDNACGADECVLKEKIDFSNPFIKMSKRKLKRMKITAQKYMEQKRKRRTLEKQRKKARRAAAKAAGEQLPKRAKKTNMSDSNCKQRIAIDMSFYDKMSVRDVNRTISQLSFCYAANRRIENPTQLTIAHLDGLQKEMFFSNKTRHGWDVYIKEETLTELFERDSIVYLTADSENVLETMDTSKVYVIGGLLDHNAYKNLCLHVAQEQHFAHARLPIDEYVKLNSRKVLTINQVFEILLRYLESGSWEDAFYKVIPKRKLEVEEDKQIHENEIDLMGLTDHYENTDFTDNIVEHDAVHSSVPLPAATYVTAMEKPLQDAGNQAV